MQIGGGGAEAVEGALKLCKIAKRSDPKKTKILFTLGAFAKSVEYVYGLSKS